MWAGFYAQSLTYCVKDHNSSIKNNHRPKGHQKINELRTTVMPSLEFRIALKLVDIQPLDLRVKRDPTVWIQQPPYACRQMGDIEKWELIAITAKRHTGTQLALLVWILMFTIWINTMTCETLSAELIQAAAVKNCALYPNVYAMNICEYSCTVKTKRLTISEQQLNF